MKPSMLFICVLALLFTNCKKRDSDNDSSSLMNVRKNGVQWSESKATGTFNTRDSVISIVGVEDKETFTIRFKKPVSGSRIEKFEAASILAPARGSAVISDRYQLDTTKSNKLQILVIENTKKRILGDFYLHLKRKEEAGGKAAETYIYQGRFDVYYEEISL
ncbi:hypothetical protein SAMN04488522_104741 [Pedobacter caeni]|uniref:Uncharacterized protein n=2 Tax=Pedobacter caeni TaxID=288992 RepID=A0A1M5HNL5_9SPHI|nr:hypothetical protein SAMN04488522_104741 [Pedobacter caeni]